VWFTFRNKKVRRIKVVLKIEGHYNFIFREKKKAFFREKKRFFKEKKRVLKIFQYSLMFFFI